jgi:hypothetical protein
LTGGDEDPQQAQFREQNGGFGGGFPGGGFGGINIEDLMRQGFFGGGGHPGFGQQQHQQQRQGQGQRRATYSFSFGGGEGMKF